MPQVFQVLKCYKCAVFQIHQTKKSNKFECKICGEKQSIKRHYGIGSGKDCRLHVQLLNSLRGDMEESIQNDSEEEYDDSIIEKISQKSNSPVTTLPKQSKWSSYLDNVDNIRKDITAEPMFLGDKEVLLELLPKKKSKKIKVDLKSPSDLDNKREFFDIVPNTNETKIKDINQQTFTINNNVELENIQSASNVNESNYTLENSKRTISPQIKDKLKTSKWAQFLGTEEDNDIIHTDSSSNHGPEKRPKSNNLFSLCDENNIDSVLDI